MRRNKRMIDARMWESRVVDLYDMPRAKGLLCCVEALILMNPGGCGLEK